MGFACTMNPTKDPSDVHSRIEACHLEFMGTPIYQPPEAGGMPGMDIANHRDGPERDMFAVGLVAHVIMFGKLPPKMVTTLQCQGDNCGKQLLSLQRKWDETEDLLELKEGDENRDLVSELLRGTLHRDPKRRMTGKQGLALVKRKQPELFERHEQKNAAKRNERIATLPKEAGIPQLTVEAVIAADVKVLKEWEASEYQRKLMFVGIGVGVFV